MPDMKNLDDVVKAVEEKIGEYGGEVKNELKTVLADFNELKERMTQRDEEIKTEGQAKDTKNAERMEEIAEKLTAADEITEKLQTDLESEKKRSDELEASLDRKGKFNAEQVEQFKSLGQRYTESDEYKATNGAMLGKNITMNDVGIKSAKELIYDANMEMKLLTNEAASMGALTEETVLRRPDPFFDPNRSFHVRDILTAYPCSGDAITIIQETGFFNLYTALTTAAAPGDGTIVVAYTAGMFVGQTLTLREGTDTQTVVIAGGGIPAGLDGGPGTITLTVVIPGAITYSVAGAKVTGATFLPTTPAHQKPQFDVTTAESTINVETIANWIEVTRQLMEDAPRLQKYIDNRLRESVLRVEDQQLMYGTGATPQLNGITTDASVQTYAWSAGAVGDNQLDAILKAATLATVAEYMPDNVLMNLTDWAILKTLKGANGQYLLAMDSGSEIWSIPIKPNNVVTAGTFVTGSFSQAVEFYDRMQLVMRMSESHNDNFTRNILILLMEERIAQAIVRPQGIVVGTWDNAPAGP